MKRLLAFLLLFPLLAGAFEAYFDYRNSALEPQGVKQVHLYPVYIYDTNGVLLTRDRISRPTKADGTCTISNLLQGTYRAEFQGGYNVTTNWFQFPATNGLINAWLYRTNSAFGPLPTNGIFATLADLTNAVKASGVSSINSSTGAVSIVGAGYVTVGTTSGVVTVTGTGGGGAATTNASDLTTGTLALGLLPSAVVTNGGAIDTVLHTLYSDDDENVPILEWANRNLYGEWVAHGNFAVTNGGAFYGNGLGLSNLNGANIQEHTINSNKLDASTAAQLALVGGGSGTELTVGTNTFGILSNYVAGVYEQTTSLIIKGSTNTIANGVYSQVYSNYTSEGDGLVEALWTNGNNCGIWYWDDVWYPQLHITNSSGTLLFKSEAEGFGATLPGFPQGINLYAIGNGRDGTMGWTSNTVAEPYWELKGWQADTNLYAGDIYAGDIHGGVFYGDLSVATNYQVTSVGVVQTSNLISTVNINETLRHSFAAPVMGFVGGELLGSGEATAIGRARYLYTNGLTAAGYNLVCLDADWASRDENGLPMLKTNLYPSGLASLLNALATNDCKLGLYVSMWNWYGTLVVTEETAYRDAYTMASWGIGWLKCDGGQRVEVTEVKAKHIGELLAAGLDDGAADKGYPPVFFHYNVSTNRLFAARFANGYYATQPVEDATGNGDSVNDTAARAFQSMFAFVTNAPNITGRGIWPSLLNTGDGSGNAYWNTNCARVYVGLRCLEPYPLLIGDGNLAKTHASHIGIYTNREAIRINQDPAVGGAQWLSTNCVTITNSASQKARWRRMANGDIAVGLWNWNTNATSLFTLNLTKLPFIQTNVAYVLRVFDNVGQLVTNSLDTVVNTNGYNLLRISRNATIYDGAVLTNGAAFPVTFSETVSNRSTVGFGSTGQGWIDSNGKFYPAGLTSVGGAISSGGWRLSGNDLSVNYGMLGQYSQFSKQESPVNIGVQGASIQSDGTNLIVVLRGSSTNLLSTNNVTLTTRNGVTSLSDLFSNTLTVTNGVRVSSNSWLNVPSLSPGSRFDCSSNGVPYTIWADEAGTLHTNRLVP